MSLTKKPKRKGLASKKARARRQRRLDTAIVVNPGDPQWDTFYALPEWW